MSLLADVLFFPLCKKHIGELFSGDSAGGVGHSGIFMLLGNYTLFQRKKQVSLSLKKSISFSNNTC